MAKDSQMGPKGVRMKKCNYQTPLTSEEAKNSNRTHKKNTPYLQKFSKTLVVITNFCIILFLQKNKELARYHSFYIHFKCKKMLQAATPFL